MATKPKNKVYLVQVGPGELKSFDNWPACQAFVHGKPYKYAGGPDRAAALAKLTGAAKKGGSSNKKKWPGRDPDKPRNTIYLVEVAPDQIESFSRWSDCKRFIEGRECAYAGGVDRKEALEKLMATRERQYAARARNKPKHVQQGKPDYGLTADAGTHGNPGPCEFQVTDINGKVLAHKHLGVHTNNYTELAGIEAMIHEAVKREETVLWTDSKIAMGWIKKQKLGPTVREPELIMAMLKRIKALLDQHPQLQLKKWETKQWGEIPSDFGRK